MFVPELREDAMPTYDYLCEACQHRFEEFQQITAAVLTDCPQCKAPKLRRLIGAGGALIFKGSGFYCTDYKKDPKKKADEKRLDEKVEKAKDAAAATKAAPAPASPAPASSSGGSSGGGQTGSGS